MNIVRKVSSRYRDREYSPPSKSFSMPGYDVGEDKEDLENNLIRRGASDSSLVEIMDEYKAPEPDPDKIVGWYMHPTDPVELAELKSKDARNSSGYEDLSLSNFKTYFASDVKMVAFVGTHPLNGDPMIFTAVRHNNAHRVLVWQKEGVRHLLIPDSDLGGAHIPFRSKKPQLLLSAIADKIAFGHEKMKAAITEFTHLPAPVPPAIIRQLSTIEDDHHELEMFGNSDSSCQFNAFLGFLGDWVQLKDFDGFTAGLDNKNGHTGTHSIHIKSWKGMEIMFHVSTLLPSGKDKQHVDRKRHIGNDVCVIIFNESKQPYLPQTIRSQFNHVIGVVCPASTKDEDSVPLYSARFACKEGVPYFGPDSDRTVWMADEDFRDFLLTKLVNGQISATKNAAKFQEPVSRYRKVLFNKLVVQFHRRSPSTKIGQNSAETRRKRNFAQGMSASLGASHNTLKVSLLTERRISLGGETDAADIRRLNDSSRSSTCSESSSLSSRTRKISSEFFNFSKPRLKRKQKPPLSNIGGTSSPKREGVPDQITIIEPEEDIEENCGVLRHFNSVDDLRKSESTSFNS